MIKMLGLTTLKPIGNMYEWNANTPRKELDLARMSLAQIRDLFDEAEDLITDIKDIFHGLKETNLESGANQLDQTLTMAQQKCDGLMKNLNDIYGQYDD